MSLPLHLQSIKSSGVYRFVYDKSIVPDQVVTTLRLLVGYSEKGPFNTPVYITTPEEFTTTFGNISKRLEKKGVFFHRLALQALNYGPILCLNLKPFDKKTGEEESVRYATFKGEGVFDIPATGNGDLRVTSLYDTNRFWALDSDTIPSAVGTESQFITITATDVADASCSLIIRPAKPEQYDLTIREWYGGISDEMPEYLTKIQDDKLNNYFMDVYVFRGEFTPDLCGVDGPLGKYFNVTDNVITLEENYVDSFGEPADVLEALAADDASNFVAAYRGTTIPYFKGTNGNYLSIDLLFNSGFSDHKMLMKLDETQLDPNETPDNLRKLLKLPGDVTRTADAAADPADSTYNANPIKDTIAYYELKGKYEQYSPSPAPASAVKVATAPDTATEYSIPELKDKPEIVYTETTGDNPTKTYYHLVYAYSSVSATTTIKKKAEEAGATVPTSDLTRDSSRYVFTTTVLPAAGTEESAGSYSISPVYLAGFTYHSMEESQDYPGDSIGVIVDDNYGKGLQEALTNRVDSEYHYLVDTYNTTADAAGANTKSILAAVAKKKDNAFAILNFPRIKDFVNAGSTYKTSGTLDFKKVCKKSAFPLPDDNGGASWAAYFTQVVLSDGTVKTTVPSAGLVSNLFEDKWTSRQPYYIVAGSQFGRLFEPTLVGPDYAFSRTDRDVLEPYGINVIVYEPRRGTYINSEQTCKQIPISALSKIHIRELVIYLQDEIADLLESYRWELNTQVLRQTIKGKADTILEQVRGNGGIYDFLNICDDTNNTTEMIDNEILVLDTHIEPARGTSKMIEQLYLYRTGEMRSQLIVG